MIFADTHSRRLFQTKPTGYSSSPVLLFALMHNSNTGVFFFYFLLSREAPAGIKTQWMRVREVEVTFGAVRRV